MKTTDSKSFEDFPSTTLYLNDLKEILIVLTENCEEVKIRTEKYNDITPDEIDELIKNLNKEKFDDIFISAYRPYITVDLRSFGVSIYISEDNIVERGVVSKIREITEKNERKHFGKVSNLLPLIPASSVGIALFESEYGISALLVVLTLVMIYPVIKYQMRNKVIVITKDKELRSSFIIRKKDELIVALVAAFVGALISFALFKYLAQA